MVGRLVGWLVIWLVGWLMGWLVGCLVSWLVGKCYHLSSVHFIILPCLLCCTCLLQAAADQPVPPEPGKYPASLRPRQLPDARHGLQLQQAGAQVQLVPLQAVQGVEGRP